MVNTTKSFLRFLFLFLLTAVTAYSQDLKDHKDSPVKFEVLSVRLASPEESQSDNIGMDVIVRFRLSNKGRPTVYFYTSWKDHIIPEGYTIRSFEDRTEWFVGLEQTTKKPPGINRFMTRGDGGAWLALSKGMSIEYELFDSTTRNGGKHGQTVFIKAEEKGVINEVVSEFYELPTKTIK